ncbi:15689_t:CDS:2 [Acaulospora colombiana]|uniref:15689_t:CDS:1 n=1 Tax=Acaulospora colombiana TaxID=27376 RepID=A0ACA9L1D6_9GLOM|nr:15689_t:CDS:2 [Acaulospora colombiana]
MVTMEGVHLIVKKCADEIRERGLCVVDIFKPIRIGENEDEVRELVNFLLEKSQSECKDELRKHDIHDIGNELVKHTTPPSLHRCNAKPTLGKFSVVTEILCEVFSICADVTAESHINKMSAQRLVKSFALCLMGNHEQGGKNFDSAYTEWTKCSNACLHLFLAYLRERSVSESLNPRLTMLLDNYVEYRKKSIASTYFEHPLPDTTIEDLNSIPKPRSRKQSSVTFTQTEINEKKTLISELPSSSRPVSILKVTRQVPVASARRETRRFTTLLPEMIGGLKRKTIIRTSIVMTLDEKRNAEQMWEAFQSNGVGAMSDDYLKLYFAIEERDRKSTYTGNPDNLLWTHFSRKGFKSLHLDPPEIIVGKSDEGQKSITDNAKIRTISKISEKEENEDEPDKGQEVQLARNDSGVSVGDSMRQTVVWDEFSSSGFRDNVDNISNLSLPIGEALSVERVDTENKENENDVEPKGKSRKGSVAKKKFVKFRSLRRPPRTRSFDHILMDKEEDWEDWDIISRTEDLPVATHLSIETVDEIFPYVWMETTAEGEGNRWGDWVFIEPKKGLVNECEWVMIEEKAQIFSDGELKKSYTRRKMSIISTFSIPWVTSRGKPRPVSKVSTAHSFASSKLPQPPRALAMFDRARTDDSSDIMTTNYRFGPRRFTKKDISGPYPQERRSVMHFSRTKNSGYADGNGTTMQYEKYQYNYSGDDYESDPGYYNEYQDGYYDEYPDGHYDGYQDGYYDEEYWEDDYYHQQGYAEEDGYYDQVGYDYSGGAEEEGNFEDAKNNEESRSPQVERLLNVDSKEDAKGKDKEVLRPQTTSVNV